MFGHLDRVSARHLHWRVTRELVVGLKIFKQQAGKLGLMSPSSSASCSFLPATRQCLWIVWFWEGTRTHMPFEWTQGILTMEPRIHRPSCFRVHAWTQSRWILTSVDTTILLHPYKVQFIRHNVGYRVFDWSNHTVNSGGRLNNPCPIDPLLCVVLSKTIWLWVEFSRVSRCLIIDRM